MSIVAKKVPSLLETLDNAIRNVYSSMKTGNDFDRNISSSVQEMLNDPEDRRKFDEAVQRLKANPNQQPIEITTRTGATVKISLER